MNSMDSVSRPVITAHVMRSHGAPSESSTEPLEVMFAMMSEPESALVT
ncbi:hypothetical protein MILU53160_09565 [Micrococcus luteus]